jgi:hypothetical protein
MFSIPQFISDLTVAVEERSLIKLYGLLNVVIGTPPYENVVRAIIDVIEDEDDSETVDNLFED